MKVSREQSSDDANLLLYSLEGCPFCIEAKKVLERMKVKHTIVDVTHNEKEKIKKELRRSTFPQLVLIIPKGSGSEKVMLGGFEDLERIVAVCKLLRKAKIDGRAINYICQG